MAKVSLKFGQLVPQDPRDFGPIVQTAKDAINKGRVHRRDGSLVLFFMEPKLEHILGRDVLAVYFAFAQGASYRAPDPDTGDLVDMPYDAPPYKSRTLILVDSAGNVIVEAKKTTYIDPRHVIDALDRTIRKHGSFSSAFSLTLKDIPKQSSIFEEALEKLRRLDVVAIENLRHSNPRPRSEHYDAISDQRIQRIRYASEHSAGIDREHAEFQSFKEHVRDYASYQEVAGLGTNSYEILRADGGELELTIELPGSTDESMRINAIYRYSSRYLGGRKDTHET